MTTEEINKIETLIKELQAKLSKHTYTTYVCPSCGSEEFYSADYKFGYDKVEMWTCVACDDDERYQASELTKVRVVK